MLGSANCGEKGGVMELGNMAFGNSRGEFSVSRREFENDMFRLLDALLPESGIYGTEFENDVFSTLPYWWGDCTCGWDFLDNGHEIAEGLEHLPDCYQHEYRYKLLNSILWLDSDSGGALDIPPGDIGDIPASGFIEQVTFVDLDRVEGNLHIVGHLLFCESKADQLGYLHLPMRDLALHQSDNWATRF